MDYHRVTEIYDPMRKCGGTGYLIRPNLILTAHHVVAPLGQPGVLGTSYDVRLIGDFIAGQTEWRTNGGRLCWDDPDPKHDLALIRLDGEEPACLSRRQSLIRFGKIGGETLKAKGLGFPRVQKVENRSNPEPIEGRLSWLAGLKEHQLRLQVTSLIPDRACEWEGISGTSLFVKDCLVGVVIETNKSFGDKALWAVPISIVADDAEFRRQLFGDPNATLPFTDFQRGYIKQRNDKEQTIRNSIQVIYKALRSEHEQLFGRVPDLNKLSQLLKPISQNAGVVISAIGGMGKTAVARELCIERKLWNAYEIVIGSTARLRRVQIDPERPQQMAASLQQTKGKQILNIRDFFVTIAKQLNVVNPDVRSDNELIKEIKNRLQNKTSLVIFDNLETIPDTQTALLHLTALCDPPYQKILVTTRHEPPEFPEGLIRILLEPIKDVTACRELVFTQLPSNFSSSPIIDNAVGEIVELSKGHPLAMKLLSGKLITQGAKSINMLKRSWEKKIHEKLDDLWLKTLYQYIFDDIFLERIGQDGVDLLQIIADEEAGVAEEDLKAISEMESACFYNVLDEIFRANCIYREEHLDMIVLNMHPLTRAYFRTSYVEDSEGDMVH